RIATAEISTIAMAITATAARFHDTSASNAIIPAVVAMIAAKVWLINRPATSSPVRTARLFRDERLTTAAASDATVTTARYPPASFGFPMKAVERRWWEMSAAVG